MPFIGSHDCEQAGVYTNELIDGERIVITEKIHGSQLIYACNVDNDEELVSSKGLLKSQLKIEESPDNTYWKAVRNDKLFDMVKASFDSGVVQIFGEVIPVQKGYNYGQVEPTVRLFDIRHDGVSIPYDQVADCFKAIWVPVIYDGPVNLIVKATEYPIGFVKEDKLLPKEIVDLCQGNELVSGKEVHIREGVVLRPYIDRLARDRTKLRLKIINPKYKETGEEFN
jgi:hypothetical protein